MVLPNFVATIPVDFFKEDISFFDFTIKDLHMKQMLAMVCNRDIGHFCFTVCRGNPSLIGYLSARKGIEVRFGKSNISLFVNRIDFLSVDK